MTKRTALTILGFGWCLAISIATIPLIWNKWETAQECEFDELLHPWYVAGVITPIFSVVWLCLFVVYWRIWREASKHAKQLRAHGGASERTSSDWKSVQVSCWQGHPTRLATLVISVLFFMSNIFRSYSFI